MISQLFMQHRYGPVHEINYPYHHDRVHCERTLDYPGPPLTQLDPPEPAWLPRGAPHTGIPLSRKSHLPSCTILALQGRCPLPLRRGVPTSILAPPRSDFSSPQLRVFKISRSPPVTPRAHRWKKRDIPGFRSI